MSPGDALTGKAAVLETRSAVARQVAWQLLKRASKDAAKAAALRNLEARAALSEAAAMARAQAALTTEGTP